jgi:DNA-binding transcriptional LysR family regulator
MIVEWSKLKYFYYVGKEGSITEAAKKRNISQPALSRQIIILEKELGHRLFERNRYGVKLTDRGRLLFNQTKKMADSAKLAVHEISDENTKIRGPLKIFTSPVLASRWVMHYLESFQKAYPYVRLHLCTDTTSLTGKSGDVYIIPYEENAEEYCQKYITGVRSQLYASKSYLEKFGAPQSVGELDHHRIIAFSSENGLPAAQSYWSLTIGMKKGEYREPYLESDMISFLLCAAEEGLGIVELPKGYPDPKKSNLVEVLPELAGPKTELYFTVREDQQDISRIKALLEHIRNGTILPVGMPPSNVRTGGI